MLLFLFYTHLLKVLLISIFDVRRYHVAYLSCAYLPRTMKFTTVIDELVGKNESIPSKHGGYKTLP